MASAPAIRIEEVNDTNCKTYLLSSGRSAALVDPLRERLDTYRELLATRGLALEMIIETHLHADHLMLGRDAKAALGAPIFMHRESPSPLVDAHLEAGQVLELGGAPIRVLHTPGHTPDSICLVTGDSVLTGDTLLIDGSGRTDFPGGDPGAQYDHVTTQLFALPDATIVLPAHDYQGRKTSTIGRERADNERFCGRSRAEYIELMNGLGLPFPDRIQEALQVNQTGFDADEITFPKVAEVAALPELSPAEVLERLRAASPPLLLDVREPEEFVGELGHVEGALLIPIDSLAHRLPKLAGYVGRDVVVVCRAGARSASAGALLRRAGFRCVYNLAGGMLAWRAEALPTQR